MLITLFVSAAKRAGFVNQCLVKLRPRHPRRETQMDDSAKREFDALAELRSAAWNSYSGRREHE